MELYWDYSGKSIFGYVWRFPKMGLPPNHPCYFRILHYELSSNWGTHTLGNLQMVRKHTRDTFGIFMELGWSPAHDAARC